MRSRPGWMIPLILILYQGMLWSQSWTIVDPETINPTGSRDIIPQACITYQTDYLAMKALLWSAPHEFITHPAQSNTIITVGLADGSADMFRVVQYDMMEAPLASEYPDMKTFKGISISNPYRRIRIDWTKNGFRAVVGEPGGKMYIDPYQREDMIHRIAYYASEFSRPIDWTCGVTEGEFHGGETPKERVVGDCDFRSYRLAVATTGEYSNYFGATSPAQSGLVLSQVITAVNRINEVYEFDVAVRFILISNTDDVFYYDPGGDPYTGDDACVQLNQNQTTVNSVIGSANYDIGHVFGVGSGGCAQLGVVCTNNFKAKGATGLNPPTGDPFYIDYVAHEIGHQFGGNHTQNNSCQRNAATAMEPGSASTIMGYAGICSPNVQSNSDDYIHGINLQEMATEISTHGCDVLVSAANSAPVVTNVPNYTIPKSTPFVLTATATDGEDDPLTYCWEQWDQEVGVMPPDSMSTLGPMFRSLDPSTSPSRYFPNLPDLVDGLNPTWEELPSVGRTMEFRVTVRDNFDALYGCTDEDNTIITVTAAAGPFKVTSQNSPDTWYEGTMDTVTWNVANTTGSPVNCANVNIYLSLDGGMTYPVVLASNEPNDGLASFTVPVGVTDSGRIMVKASNNIFFDINNADIEIDPALPDFGISLNPLSVEECNDGSVQTMVEVQQLFGFSDPVSLSLLNPPPGAVVMFAPQIVEPGSSSTLTISNLMGLFGTYTPTVRGTSTTGNKDVIFNITLEVSAPGQTPTLLSPTNNNTNVVITPFLDWQSLMGINQYEFQVAYDNMFNAIAQSGMATTSQFQVTSPLLANQQYFWRVRSVNICGNSSWSSVFSFTTNSCFALMSSNVPVAIPVGVPTVTSTFNNGIEMVINDVNIMNLTGTHTWMDDLEFTLISPEGTERLFWDQPCTNHDNFNINFDDEAQNSNWPCPPTNAGTYKPDALLSIFDGEEASGIWTLEIHDVYVPEDGGSLSTWGLRVCGNLGCQLIVTQTTGTGTGSLPGAISCASPGDTIRLSALLSGQTVDIGGSPLLMNKDLVILAEASNINITGSGARVFEIDSAADVEFSGLKITAGTSMTAGAINNPGILRLTNAIIEKNPGVSGASLIQNSPGAQMFVAGSCYLNQ